MAIKLSIAERAGIRSSSIVRRGDGRYGWGDKAGTGRVGYQFLQVYSGTLSGYFTESGFCSRGLQCGNIAFADLITASLLYNDGFYSLEHSFLRAGCTTTRRRLLNKLKSYYEKNRFFPVKFSVKLK